MKNVYSSIICLLLLLLTSCGGGSDLVVGALQKAVECMEAHPDSALHILQRIPHPEKLTGKLQADYALYKTQAITKNFMPLGADSLIRVAFDYYRDSEDPNDQIMKGKAYFYYGRYLHRARRFEEALDILLQAKGILVGSQEYKMLGLISEYIGNVNLQQRLYNESLVNCEISLKYYMLVNDTTSISYAYRNIARAYVMKCERDNAYEYFMKALQLAEKKPLVSYSSIVHEFAVACRVFKDYSTAEVYMLKSLNAINPENLNSRYLSLARLNLALRNYDKSEEYFRKCINSSDLLIVGGAYYALSDMEKKRGNYQSAMEYRIKRDSINDIMSNDERMKIVADLQAERLKNENLQIKSRQESIISWSSSLFLLLALIGLYSYYRFYMNKSKGRKIETAMSANKKSLKVLEKELVYYTTHNSGQHTKEIKLLKEKIALLTHQNRNMQEKMIVLGYEKDVADHPDAEMYLAFRTLLAILSGNFNRKLTEEEFSQLIKLFNFIYKGYADRLMVDYIDITPHEVILCCFMKLGVTANQLSEVFNYEQESVRKYKTQLRNRINVISDEELEAFLAKY